jgi:hypothetical protein
MFFEELWGQCCSRSTLNMKSLTEKYCFLTSVSLLTLLKGMNDDGSPFCFLPIAPVVLFGKNASPPSKSIMQIQPSTVKQTPKRNRSFEAVAPRARAKMRKVLVRKVRKEVAPSSPNPEVPVVNQVWITFLLL